jgi:(1->4)-alpha-D-glucan 1-alpha-D-glucosylmutase
MHIDPMANAWWRDVLEHGRSATFASFFDIDWKPIKAELRGKVLLPILDRQYGHALEAGQLRLDDDDGAVVLRHGMRTLPIDPRTAVAVLGLDVEQLSVPAEDPALLELLSVLTALRNLPEAAVGDPDPERIADRRRESELARRRLARLIDGTPWVAAHVARALDAFNGRAGDPQSFDRLHELLERQAYRLAYWRTSAQEINYRRFFDVDDLAGLRMEDERVFAATHTLVASLVESGAITGLRVDHPDGLAKPAEYFDRLQLLAAGRPDRVGDLPIYIVAEKILTPGQQLPGEWRVHGTTGYEFMNAVNGLFVPARHVSTLRRIYRQFTSRRDSFADVAYASKRLVMETSLASELNVLAHALNRIAERNRRSRDFTLNSLRRALREFIACLSVYRTYVSETGRSAADEDRIFSALADARRRNPELEATIFDFIAAVLLDAATTPAGRSPREALEQYAPADDEDRRERRRVVLKLQQYTGPVHAKGVEDTAFYRYNLLIAINEVGGDPSRVGTTLDEFHEQNARRLARWPLEMTATSTHDSKLGEDVRARIDVLAEMPDRWRAAVGRWARLTARHRTRVLGEWAPDRNDEYRFYQVLAGIWPSDAADPAAAAAALVPRLSAYMRKSIKEAKIHTSWINDNEAYDAAVDRFVARVLEGPTAPAFLEQFVPIVRQMARAGMVNALSQVVLKVGSPGIPDFYQGTELWDLHLVDPDNRGLVDYPSRRAALDGLGPLLDAIETATAPTDRIRDLFNEWPDGRIKLFVTAAALRERRRSPDLYVHGGYEPVEADAHGVASIVAFVRSLPGRMAVAAAARHVADLIDARDALPVGDAWHGHRIPLPGTVDAPPVFRDALTGRVVPVHRDSGGLYLETADCFSSLPVAMLREYTP